VAKIETSVYLDKKEIDDALIGLAKSQLDKCIGGARIEYVYDNEPTERVGCFAANEGDLVSVRVIFTEKTQK
jgi:hypothetical protein